MKKTLLATGLAIMSGLASAASTVVVSSPIANNARISSAIEILNNETMRIHVGTAPDYLLLSNNQLYSIQGKQATNMSAMRDQIRLPTIGDENIEVFSGLDDTRKQEVVAGVSGTVYVIRYNDQASQAHEEEIVLSSDKRVRESTIAWKTYMDRFQSRPAQGRVALQNYLDSKNLGVLRFGNHYQIESFGVTPAAGRFALPAVTP